MLRTVFIFVCFLLLVACSSGSSKSDAKTNIDTGNSASYSRTENAWTYAGTSSLGMLLKPSVGKTANEIKLWENNEIDARLTKIMGADFLKMKSHWNIETPIRKYGSFFMMTGCQQDDCAATQYVIFVHDAAGDMNVIHIGKGQTKKKWFEKAEFALPPPFAEELSALASND